MIPSFYQYSFKELQTLCEANELPLSSASLLYNWHYKKNNRHELAHQDLSQKAKTYVKENLTFELPNIDTVHQSNDKTVKFLFKLRDSLKVETVLIPFQNKYTICLSSQVGCAMNCAFCFTGKQGFSRHLKTEEIIGQFLEAKRWLTLNRPDDDRILNIVYMGQGEPLHNFDAVKSSAEIFLSQHGLSLAPYKITISTSGYLPGLQRWKSEMPNVNIALSLHSPFTEKRDELIPINKRFPLEQILPFVDAIPEDEKRFVTYEYLLLQNFNDAEADAHATGKLLSGKKAFINLIPFNPFPGSKYKRPDDEKVKNFKTILDQYKIPTTIRTTKGDEILAACGQLNTGY
ncbi:MAG: 23S rRNA (adenine(2503)-C(2))-methyltransferase RlmN [Pseudobdellovibrio sp.]